MPDKKPDNKNCTDTSIWQEALRRFKQDSLEAPRWLWLYLPILLVIIILGSRAISPDFYNRFIYTELGLVENLTVLFLIPTVIIGIMIFRCRHELPHQLLGIYIAIHTLGAFYFMGEEASWGQHWFGWEATGIFENHPREETNIHNVNHWFDQKPKAVVEAWTVIGGIGIALFYLFRKNPRNTSKLLDWVWPTTCVLPSALIAAFLKNIERLREVTN